MKRSSTSSRTALAAPRPPTAGRLITALALATALVAAVVLPAWADLVTTTDPTTGVITTVDSTTGASTTIDPSTGATSTTSTDPTSGVVTTTTSDPTSGVITTTSTDPATGQITTTTNDPNMGITTTTGDPSTGQIATNAPTTGTTTSVDPTTGVITITTTDPTSGVITTTITDPTAETATTTITDGTGATTTTTTALIEDPLHGYCSLGCIDNGTNSPTLQNPITGFGFTISPSSKPVTGDLYIDILIPSNDTHAVSYSITGSGTAATANGQTATAALYSSTAWTNGSLASYLGKTASPANPIGAYLPSAQVFDPTAIGFLVFQVDLGSSTLKPASQPNVSPLLNLTQTLPLGSYIVGFLNTGNAKKPNWVATANSGAIYEGPEIDAASGTAAIALLLGVIALVSERRRGLIRETRHG